jgi:hypothetical protein
MHTHPHKKINKRAAAIFLSLLFLSLTATAQTGRSEIELSGEGWSLWLDHAAIWANDEAYLPPVEVVKLPVNLPTVGWAALHDGTASDKIVDVPGTVEEHYWGEIGGAVPNTGGDYVGVSWWSKKFTVAPELSGKRIRLHFESVNLRAEVFVNGKLVGYDVVGNTPFEVDATDAIVFGEENVLDVRITDPVGNFSWNDNILMRWGENLVPAVHGFGGITGPVTLIATDQVHVTDIYVQNQPDPKKVRVFVTLENNTDSVQKGTLELALHEYGNPGAVAWESMLLGEVPPSSTNTFEFEASVPEARLWELAGYQGEGEENTALYEALATFSNNNMRDSQSQRFGFRWFDMQEKDGDKRFYLNGERVVILAAMTRGYWPTNGIFATPEMAQRDKEALQEMGLNMMLLHRAIGQPPVMEYADKSGLLTYEEPGGYRVAPNPEDNIDGPNDQALEWRLIKLARMVIRDRSLPSMVIYNLKNEARKPPDNDDYANVQMVHDLDPSRIVTYNSDRNRDIPYYEGRGADPYKLHMLPFDETMYISGWFDQHHWFGYSGYVDQNYNHPGDYLRGSVGAPRVPDPMDYQYRLNPNDLIFWGEEGAFGTMVRLEKIKEELEEKGATGFREMEHLDWFNYYDEFLDRTGFRESYPSVDSLTMSLGRNLLYFQGRNIENVRISNVADAYVMNGWGSASTRTDIVDMYRNPTADPALVNHYIQPLYVAVKLRNKVLRVGETPIVDFYIVNEVDLQGEHTLSVTYTGPEGETVFSRDYQVQVTGGEEFGELLARDIELPELGAPGYYNLKASLHAGGDVKATGFDEVFAVDLQDAPALSGRYAVIEDDNIVKDFLAEERNITVHSFNPNDENLDVIIVGSHDYGELGDDVVANLMQRVINGSKLIVLQNADYFADAIDDVLQGRPTIHSFDAADDAEDHEGIVVWNGQGRLFVGQSEYLDGLPQAEGMSWEYQSFYKTNSVGRNGQVSGIRLHDWGTELIAAVGHQGQKEILSALAEVQVGDGEVILSTLTIPANLVSDDESSVVAKRLFLNILQH